MTSTLDLLKVAQAAVKFADATHATAAAKKVLTAAYFAWGRTHGNGDFITKGTPQWDAMLVATAHEYRQVQTAKARERRAKAALLAAATELGHG